MIFLRLQRTSLKLILPIHVKHLYQMISIGIKDAMGLCPLTVRTQSGLHSDENVHDARLAATLAKAQQFCTEATGFVLGTSGIVELSTQMNWLAPIHLLQIHDRMQQRQGLLCVRTIHY